MTENSSAAVERLDFSKLPPGYALVQGGHGFLFFDADGERHGAAMHDLGHDWSYDTCLRRAWAHYKERHDPPGMEVYSDGEIWCFATRWTVALHDSPHGSESGARAAAWAWYERRLALAKKVEAEAGRVVEHDDADDALTRCTVVRNADLAAYLGHEALVGYAELSAEELLKKNILTFEGDPPIEREPLNIWPRCLTWPDDQVAEVERWLVDLTAEIPEALRV